VLEKFSQNAAYLGGTEDEHAALAYLIIAHCIESEDHNIEVHLARPYNRGENQFSGLQSTFFAVFVEPLYEYIDEHLDDQRAVLALLRRYKHKCEWFQRDYINELLGAGERKLAYHLYEYLFDQGIEFSIEPTSASGEADLVAAQKSSDPLVADVKIFDPAKSKGKSYILRGFRQVYTYALDYNEPFGYMVVFNNSGKDLALPSALTEQSTPLFTHNNKTIFVLVVDVYEYQDTASVRGRLEAIVISEDEFTREITAT
jgi:hypothetical protein